eukprot:scaffold26338_cov49-Attheya_sp.AAC.12
MRFREKYCSGGRSREEICWDGCFGRFFCLSQPPKHFRFARLYSGGRNCRCVSLSDEVVASLVFERILGKGTYKTVYLVSGHDATGNDVKYAMAVERLRVKSYVKDAFRGIRVAEKLLQTLLEHNKDKDLFERIERWWVQSNSLPDFSEGASIYNTLAPRKIGRTNEERAW